VAAVGVGAVALEVPAGQEARRRRSVSPSG